MKISKYPIPILLKVFFRMKSRETLILKQSLFDAFLTRHNTVQAVAIEVTSKSTEGSEGVTKLCYDLSGINIHLVNTSL